MKKNAMISFRLVSVLLAVFFCLSQQAEPQSAEKIGTLFEKLAWRTIGPALMGGRTVGIDVVESQPWIIYAAIGPSGVWKSENNGVTWFPVFDKEKTVSVGAVAVAQSHPVIVWVGTGEATCRNSVTIGDGAYKSTDGGKTWQNMGLEETRHISRIIINRGDPNIVYVAAMGHLWGPNKERGVFKTMDGGKTWWKVLFIDENTGIAELAVDPSDSLVLYAAAYEHRRLPYYFSSGGPGSGLYKTADGGETWEKLARDLPEGIMGRIGVDVSRSNPAVIYALIEHKDGGIWRSEDKGGTWKRMCDYETFKRVNTRPFYYSNIKVDPTDDRVVYVFSTGLHVSTDMGKTFKPIGFGTHPDHHALWINPSNPLHLIDGNDGGIDISYDGGKNWHSIQHMELAEVYQVGYDMRKPYHVYVGLQDNGTWGGPSASMDPVGIANDDWSMIGGGDGFFVQPDPEDHNVVYRNYQMNGLSRFDLRIGRGKNIKPLSSLKEPPFRFNWNSPIHISPHDSKTVYTGGNHLFKTTDGGHSWTIISPDLTTNDPKKQVDSGGPITPDNSGAEIHCTITTISESPVEKGVIWVGTDDGNVQVTRDGGKTWRNVVRNIPGLPPNTWCSRIEASRFAAGTAYAAFDGHRTDDYNTHVYKTTDFGRTWKSIKGNLPFGWVHVIREDMRNKNLLFVGMEFGVYASLDGGNTWFSLQNNLPTVAVHDIAVHPRDNDLIIGTHGRGVWILDDISPLQEMSEEALGLPFHLFGIREATAYHMSSLREPYTKPVYTAKNPPYGMILNVFIKEDLKERPKISIKDAGGKVISELNLSTKAGLQREVWNLQFVPETKEGKKITASGPGFFSLPLAPPGGYEVEIFVGEQPAERNALILVDPRYEFKYEDRKAQLEVQAEVLAISRTMSLAVTACRNIRRQLESLKKDIGTGENINEELRAALKSFEEEFRNFEKEIVPGEMFSLSSRELALRGGGPSLQVMSLAMSIGGFPSRPTETDLFLLAELAGYVTDLVSGLNGIIKTEIPKLNDLLKAANLKTLTAPEEIKL